MSGNSRMHGMYKFRSLWKEAGSCSDAGSSDLCHKGAFCSYNRTSKRRKRDSGWDWSSGGDESFYNHYKCKFWQRIHYRTYYRNIEGKGKIAFRSGRQRSASGCSSLERKRRGIRRKSIQGRNSFHRKWGHPKLKRTDHIRIKRACRLWEACTCTSS